MSDSVIEKRARSMNDLMSIEVEKAIILGMELGYTKGFIDGDRGDEFKKDVSYEYALGIEK